MTSTAAASLEPLYQALTAFMTSGIVRVAIEFDLFSAVCKQSNIGAIAAATGCSRADEAHAV
jgi:hypothetical protein